MPYPRDDDPNRYISDVRVGFQVRLPKIDVCTYFNNGDGGRDAALLAARAYRDALLAQTAYTKAYKAHSRRRDSNGDRRQLGGLWLVAVRRASGSVRGYFRVVYKDAETGRHHSKTFWISKHGYVGAYRLAFELRRQFVDTVSAELAEMPKPTAEQYALLSRLAGDVPRPE